ncbi:MAG: hypothetical protein QXU88_02650 [Candidatus Woesearchaeota archaeon]
MQITIDTNRDSPEDIKKAIKALLAILGSPISESLSKVLESSNPIDAQQENIFGNIFGDEAPLSASGEEVKATGVNGESKVEVY